MKFDINTDQLLSIEDICKKLAISRSTLERWRSLENKPILGNISKSSDKINPFQKVGVSQNNNNDVEDDMRVTDFPDPTIYLGRSPRWSSNVINRWINRQR